MTESKIDLSHVAKPFGFKHQLFRMVWSIVWTLGTWWLPRSLGAGWKRLLLRLFGAKIGRNVHVYSTARIFYPPLLTMGDNSCLAADVRCYNIAPITIGANTTISEDCFLCTASHDISDAKNPMVCAPIVIGDQAWIGARAFIGMGVTIGQGSVVGARAAVFKSVEPWKVVGGNPARVLKERVVKVNG